MNIEALTKEYADLYQKRQKLREANKDITKGLKEIETQLIYYIEENGLKKLPIIVGEKTMYISLKSGVQLK